MRSPYAAALFAGGRSTRFGSDKAFFEIDGVPLWRRQLAKLEVPMPTELLLSANAEQRFSRGPGDHWRLVVDGEPDGGPMVALASCLRATALPRLLVLAVDLPDLPESLVGELAYCDCGVVPVWDDGHVEPLAAVYPAEVLPMVERRIAAGDLAMQGLVAEAVNEGLMVPRPIADVERGWFRNWNRRPEG